MESPVTYHRLTSDPYKESGSSIPRSGLCSFPSTSRINQLPGSSLPGAKPSACPRPLVSAVGSPSQSSGTGRYGCLGSWVRHDGLKYSPLVRLHAMRSDRCGESATRQRFTVLTDQSCRWNWMRVCVDPSAASVFWTTLAPIPIRADQPKDQPGGEPGEQNAQSYRDKRLHNRSSRNISRSWMSSICRADHGL